MVSHADSKYFLFFSLDLSHPKQLYVLRVRTAEQLSLWVLKKANYLGYITVFIKEYSRYKMGGEKKINKMGGEEWLCYVRNAV